LSAAIARLDRTIVKMAQKDETARRLMSIPGFGPITASAMAATLQDTSSFAGPRRRKRDWTSRRKRAMSS
jgi:transposase